MTTKRLYIGKKDPEVISENLEEWITDKVGDPPPNTRCECPAGHDSHSTGDCSNIADTFSYQIERHHICYSWLCGRCMWATTSDDYAADMAADVPVTADGYAVAPRHCS